MGDPPPISDSVITYLPVLQARGLHTYMLTSVDATAPSH